MPIIFESAPTARSATDYTFELGGFPFGRDLPLFVQDFDPGSPEWVTQDEGNPNSDGDMFGRDYLRGPVWTFTLGTMTCDAEGAQALIRHAMRVWRQTVDRRNPGAETVLRYGIAGEMRRVYGRPRNFDQLFGDRGIDDGYASATATFKLSDHLTYDDTPQSVSLDLLATSAGGLELPAVLPAELGRNASERQGIVDVEGDTPTPFTATIHGPSTGTASKFWLTGPGWRIDVDRPLAWDQTMTIDTRAHTVLRSDGASLSGGLSRRSDLSARMEPGPAEVAFGANDPSFTARAVIEWHPAMEAM